MIRIENWAVCANETDMYTPPENILLFLTGDVYGHPKHEDGRFIKTSNIFRVNGNIVETYSGSIYELGKPSDGYMEHCKKNGWHIPTEEEPIKIKYDF